MSFGFNKKSPATAEAAGLRRLSFCVGLALAAAAVGLGTPAWAQSGADAQRDASLQPVDCGMTGAAPQRLTKISSLPSSGRQ